MTFRCARNGHNPENPLEIDHGTEVASLLSAVPNFDEIRDAHLNALPVGALQDFHSHLDRAEHSAELLARLARLLLDPSSTNQPQLDGPNRATQSLFEALLENGRYLKAAGLIEALREKDATRVEDANYIHQTISRFARRHHVSLAIRGLASSSSRLDALRYLDALGPYAVPSLLDELDISLDSTVQDQIAILLVSHTPEPGRVLSAKLKDCRPEAAISLLEASEPLPDGERSPLIWTALRHRQAVVRVAAVRALRRFLGAANEAICSVAADESEMVRIAVLELICARAIPLALPMIEPLLDPEILNEMGPRERELTTEAYARVAGPKSVPHLANILVHSGLGKVDIKVAAAAALGFVGTREAEQALSRAARSLNRRVRQAASRALEFADIPTLPGEAAEPGPTRRLAPSPPEQRYLDHAGRIHFLEKDPLARFRDVSDVHS